MSGAKIQELSLPDGSKVRGVEVDFDVVKEDWNIYKLPDGTEFRAKNVLVKVFQLVDAQGNPLHDAATGEPELFVDSKITVAGGKVPSLSDLGITREVRPDGTDAYYAIHPTSKERVEIDPDQIWFWTPEWQAGERQVDEDLQSGNYEEFDDIKEFIDSL